MCMVFPLMVSMDGRACLVAAREGVVLERQGHAGSEVVSHQEGAQIVEGSWIGSRLAGKSSQGVADVDVVFIVGQHKGEARRRS